VTNYEDKEERLRYIWADISSQFCRLHPTDRAEAYRKVEEWAGERAKLLERINERDGVPERSQGG
jgi:hypothetical protein